MARKNKIPRLGLLVKELKDLYEVYDRELQAGAADAADRDEMLLIKIQNDILYTKKIIVDLYPRAEKPECYFRKIPPVVPSGMRMEANEDHTSVQKLTSIFENNKHYKYLINNFYELSPDERKKEARIGRVIYHVQLLCALSEKDEPGELRWNASPDILLKELRIGAERLSKILEKIEETDK